MERRYINLPISSLAIREYSLILSLLFLLNQCDQISINPLLAFVSCWGIYRVIQTIILDNGYSTYYKVIISCVMIIALALILYGIFFSEKYVQYNQLISIIGLCVTCGSVLIGSIIVLCQRRRFDVAGKSNEIIQRLFDVTHILMLYIVILSNL